MTDKTISLINKEILIIKKTWALDGVAQLVGVSSRTLKKVGGLIPGQGTYLGCGFSPRLGHLWGQPIDVSLWHWSHCLSLPHSHLPLSLKSINRLKNFLKKDTKTLPKKISKRQSLQKNPSSHLKGVYFHSQN